jgi:hypothetical protein
MTQHQMKYFEMLKYKEDGKEKEVELRLVCYFDVEKKQGFLFSNQFI